MSRLDALGPWVTLRLSPRFRWRMYVRRKLAERFLSGRGVEIGGLIMPVVLPSDARVHHLDAWTSEELRRRYPQYRWVEMVSVDVVADGEELRAIRDGSIDFLVANHLVEHCRNPLASIESWLRVLRPGGVLFMAVPDKRRTFDRERPLTSPEHLIRDYREGAGWSEDGHWREYVRAVLRVPPDREESAIAREKELDHRPHYHVWTADTFREMLARIAPELAVSFRVEVIREVGIEFIVVLRRG